MKIRKILLMLVLLLVLVGCGDHIEDTNGPDDFSIETITEEQIINGYIVTAEHQSHIRQNNTYKYSVGKLTGVFEVFKGTFNEEDIAITLSTSVEEGNARIVLVYKGHIMKDFLLNADNQIFTMSNCNGEVRILVVGESAKITCDALVESSKNSK